MKISKSLYDIEFNVLSHSALVWAHYLLPFRRSYAARFGITSYGLRTYGRTVGHHYFFIDIDMHIYIFLYIYIYIYINIIYIGVYSTYCKYQISPIYLLYMYIYIYKYNIHHIFHLYLTYQAFHIYISGLHKYIYYE